MDRCMRTKIGRSIVFDDDATAVHVACTLFWVFGGYGPLTREERTITIPAR